MPQNPADDGHVGGGLYMNPGAGPLIEGTVEQAHENVLAFVRDLQERGIKSTDVRSTERSEEGRWTFEIGVLRENGISRHEIDMPGIELERVRYIDGPDQNIWDFPRLYVDGSSWVWFYALSVLSHEPEDDS